MRHHLAEHKIKPTLQRPESQLQVQHNVIRSHLALKISLQRQFSANQVGLDLPNLDTTCERSCQALRRSVSRSLTGIAITALCMRCFSWSGLQEYNTRSQHIGITISYTTCSKESIEALSSDEPSTALLKGTYIHITTIKTHLDLDRSTLHHFCQRCTYRYGYTSQLLSQHH